jgi:molybdopterin/thiamine biosynthesis adenylyltransferase/rhodanese-related sulfurtransferase
MLSPEELSRYSRHLLLSEFGMAGQEKLKAAKVLVIGAGGLGCPVLMYLTAAGVGEIGIADDDKVEISNLQRQVLYSTADAGSSKAVTAAKKLRQQNPFVKFNVHELRLDNSNALDIISTYDVIVDGTDNFATRYLVNDACVILNKPLVYGSISQFEGQVSVFNFNNGPTYRCLFPTPPPPGTVLSCAEAGVLGVLPGIIGSMQANETIKLITGIGETLSGRLLLFDALSLRFTTLDISRNEAWKKTAPSTSEEILKTDYAYFCGSTLAAGKSITAKQLQELLNDKSELQLVDVREPGEEPQLSELPGLNIPLGKITDSAHLISRDKKVVVFCRSGVRSLRAIQLLERDLGFSNLYNLEGGIMNYHQ